MAMNQLSCTDEVSKKFHEPKPNLWILPHRCNSFSAPALFLFSHKLSRCSEFDHVRNQLTYVKNGPPPLMGPPVRGSPETPRAVRKAVGRLLRLNRVPTWSMTFCHMD